VRAVGRPDRPVRSRRADARRGSRPTPTGTARTRPVRGPARPPRSARRSTAGTRAPVRAGRSGRVRRGELRRPVHPPPGSPRRSPAAGSAGARCTGRAAASPTRRTARRPADHRGPVPARPCARRSDRPTERPRPGTPARRTDPDRCAPRRSRAGRRRVRCAPGGARYPASPADPTRTPRASASDPSAGARPRAGRRSDPWPPAGPDGRAESPAPAWACGHQDRADRATGPRTRSPAGRAGRTTRLRASPPQPRTATGACTVRAWIPAVGRCTR
jgi:hypothetical protein